jgi:hypothetical protein
MTSEDRDLLHSLRQQQAELQKTLERLNVQLDALESRTAPGPEVVLPPIPVDLPFPPIPADAILFPPIPPPPPSPSFPPPPPVSARKPSYELHFGRWLTWIGALSFVLFMVSFAAWFHLYERIGALGKIGFMGLVSMAVVTVAQRLERKKTGSLFFARTFLAAGLGGLYVTICSAHFVPSLLVISSSLFDGTLLLFWSLYVFYLAERRNSELLALFAVTLAYVGTAINPDSTFTLLGNLVLAATSVVFLLRTGWVALPTFGVIGTYLAVLRRLVVDDDGTLVLDTSRTLPFWPYAVYLYIVWIVFTLAVILSTVPSFRGPRRLAFLSLNNLGLAGLLALTGYIAGYGASSIGSALLDTGFVFLVTSRFAGFAEIEPVDVMGAYAAQGLALVTAGIVVIFNGMTRAIALMIETFLLGVAGAFAGDRILTISTYVAAFFATMFSIWEIAVDAHHPWLLGFGGALIMLINAWSCRGEVRHSPVARSSIVVSTSCYCVLAIALIFTALGTELGASTLPPALALAALVLTFAIYQVSLFELPPLAQILQVIALGLVLFPAETGEDLPWWTTASVGLVTLILVTWWSRQRTTRTGSWKIPLKFIYAFALVYLTCQNVHPWFDAQGWMVVAAFLSLVYLIYGAFLRVWSVAAAGQFFLALALYHFFFPPSSEFFPWSWCAAAVPIVMVFVTARAALEWLRLFPEIRNPWREIFTFIAHGYLVLALLGLARWVFGIIPESDQVAALLFLGTLVLSTNVRHRNTFGIRCSFFLSALGMWLYFATFQEQAHSMATIVNALAVLLFLAQPALLRHEGKSLVTPFENWALILFSVGTGWLFVSAWFWTRFSPGYLTLGWTLYALFLFMFGLIISENRLRACGVIILVAAILRVFFHDFWGFSGGLRVLTLLVLAIAALAVGFVLLRRDHRSTL